MLINDMYIIWTVSLLLLVGICTWIYLWIHRNKRKERLILKFTEYTAVLTFFIEKAYDIIHKDKILIYSLEATKLPDKEFGVYSKEFVRLVVKLLGPTLTSEFVYFFGDEDTFTFYLVEHFNSKYESDEIRKASIENLMQSDIEAPEELTGGQTISKIPGQS
jgi:hypothetical protein